MPHRTRPARLRALAAVLLLLAAPACGGRVPSGEARSSRSAYATITRQEIDTRAWSSVLDLVSTLRPMWVRTRGADNLNNQSTPVQAYLDNTRLSGVNSLESISTAGVVAVDFVDGVEAAARWGLNHSQGAIVVRTRP